jgi:GT2 family glycosyltransferase
MSTSVIIVSYNTRDLLLACIESVLTHSALDSRQIFVVDNASGDGSAQAVADRYPGCRLIANQTNRGFGAANNQALAEIDTEYVLLLNPDARLLPGALAAMQTYLVEHPEVAIVGPRTYFPDNTVQDSTYNFPRILSETVKALSLEPLIRRVTPGSSMLVERYYPEVVCEVDWLRGACLMCNRKALSAVSGFDERFFLYSEEVDLQYRIREAGYSIVFLPQAGVIHHLGASMAMEPVKNYIQLFRSKLQFAEKHYHPLYVAMLYLIWLSYNLARSAFYSLAALVGNADLYKARRAKNLAASRYLLTFLVAKVTGR